MNLNQWVSKFNKCKVLCIGDVMLDRFIYGKVTRISPEAPVPILKVEQECHMLGGAGNVVRNISALGAIPSLISIIGNDNAGQEVKELLEKDKVSASDIIADDRFMTGIKARYLADSQQVLRTDYENVIDMPTSMTKGIIRKIKRLIKTCNVVILSDYGKGLLNPQVTESIISAARKLNCPIIIDPKGSDYSRYKFADLVTPNRSELEDVIGNILDTEQKIVEAAKAVLKKYKLGSILVTRSQDGMSLITANGDITHLSAEALEVFDVSGAGDTVVATMATTLAAGATLPEAAALANLAAGIVVGKVGTAVAYASDILSQMHNQSIDTKKKKLIDFEHLVEVTREWRRQGLKIGFTNGCFDLLHHGHISLLSQAKTRCDRLIVGLNSDCSVKRIKGNNRPIQNEKTRSTVLTSIELVDVVTIFDEENPLKLIMAIKPDVLIKGSDYKRSQIIGADIVKKQGGKVFLAKLEKGYSTTNTISKMTNRQPNDVNRKIV